MKNKLLIALCLVLVLFTVSFATDRGGDESFSGRVNMTKAVIEGQIAFCFEGATRNAFQYCFRFADPTVDRFMDIPNADVDLGAISNPLWSNIGNPIADKAFVFANDEITSFSMADINEDMYTISGVGNFGDVSIFKVIQETGNPTNGTVAEFVSSDTDTDALVVTANSVSPLVVAGDGTLSALGANTASDIDFLDFDVSADGAVTIASDADNTMITLSPSIATTLAIDVTDTDIATALSVGANDIVGTTGLIDYTNFDVNADGDVAAVDGIFTGNVSVTGTFLQDALSATTADTTLTVDGTGTGGVSIGTAAGTGPITLGGSATAVNLAATVDLTLAGGDITATDTANADMVTFTNNTITTADLVTLNAGGTRTSDNVIEISDAATTATTIGITANTQTSGNGISYSNSGAALTGAGLYISITDGAGFTGDYITGFDGAADDFAFKRYGALTIAGLASTDMITVTTGDVQVDDGKLEIDTDEDDTTKIERAQATVTGPVLTIVEQTHTAASGHSALLVDQDTTTATVAAIEIDTEGALAIKVDALIAAGDGIKIDVADSYTGQGIVADLGPWLGTTSEGFINIESDSGAVNEVGQAIRVNLQGTGTAGTAVEGKAFHAESNAAVKAGESLVYLDTLTNTAIHIQNGGAAADGIKFDVEDAYTGQGILADLGPHVGTVSEGFINIETDAAATDVAGMALRINLQDSLVDTTAISGKGIFVKEVSPVKAGTYVAHFESTSNGSISAQGTALFADTVNLSGPVNLGDADADTITINGNLIKNTETIVNTAAGTLTLADCGKTIFLNHGTVGIDVTLPAVAGSTGCTYKFIHILTTTDDHTINTNAGEDKIVVQSFIADGNAGIADDDADIVTFLQAADSVGDACMVESSGAFWYFNCTGAVSGAFSSGTT